MKTQFMSFYSILASNYDASSRNITKKALGQIGRRNKVQIINRHGYYLVDLLWNNYG